ncbi:C-type mannose receptor 2 [Saguinus oedipus]|uniref:C-type mannose receptor 2 n=1 Tax=Saguinus oedipus TaxID=9490 RepID=A0ABQ9VNF3_SAGOE|nr:C-type mannose receptor 2 [Saguinus oedipus]
MKRRGRRSPVCFRLGGGASLGPGAWRGARLGPVCPQACWLPPGFAPTLPRRPLGPGVQPESGCCSHAHATPAGQQEWLHFQEAEYKFFEHHSTWAQAQRICTWFQAELTSVHSQAELDFLSHNMQKFSWAQEQHWWIGLYTSEIDGRFRTASAQGQLGPYLEAPSPWVTDCTELSSPTPQPAATKPQNLGPSLPPFLRPSLLHPVEAQPWAGAGVTSVPCHCRWTDGSVINFISWAPGKPRPVGKDKKCVYMTASREDWGDQRCLTSLPYVCKRSNVSKETQYSDLPATFEGGCSSGWLQFLNKPPKDLLLKGGQRPFWVCGWGGGAGCYTPTYAPQCFKIEGRDPQSKVKWSEAQFSCEQQEAQLVTVATSLEQAFITATLPNATLDLWIGLHASQREFQWVDREPVLYANWAPGEPSGPGPAPSGNKPTSCVVMLHSPSAHFTGRWDDRSCTEETHGFICQKGTDLSLSPSLTALPPTSGSDLSYLNGTFRLLQKPLRWHDALLLCESRNTSLAYVPDSYTQAFLVLAARGLHIPIWIGLAGEEVGSQHSCPGPQPCPGSSSCPCLPSPHLICNPS